MKYLNPYTMALKNVATCWLGLMSLMMSLLITHGIPNKAKAEEAFAPKPAVQLHDDSTGEDKFSSLALDQNKWMVPQSAFKWIAMASGIKTPWDSFGRQGWLTDDAYVKPVNPGISEFSPDTELFYLVFEVSALDAPSQYRAAWYYMPDGKTYDKTVVGTDALMLEMNEKSGYLEIYRPESGWKKGKYLVKLFFESPGQELYEPHVVGTMKFTITDNPAPPPTN